MPPARPTPWWSRCGVPASIACDPAGADLLTGVSRELDKQLWLVEAQLG